MQKENIMWIANLRLESRITFLLLTQQQLIFAMVFIMGKVQKNKSCNDDVY